MRGWRLRVAGGKGFRILGKWLGDGWGRGFDVDRIFGFGVRLHWPVGALGGSWALDYWPQISRVNADNISFIFGFVFPQYFGLVAVEF